MTSEQAGRAVVYRRSGGWCEVCGRNADTVHHRVKRGQGGTWDPANLLHLCGDGTRFCHGFIEANPTHALALGLWLPAGADPAHHPAYVQPEQFWRSWWTLDNAGCFVWADDPPENHPTAPARAAAIHALHNGRDLISA